MSTRIYQKNGKPWIDLRLGRGFRARFPSITGTKRAIDTFAHNCERLAECTIANESPSMTLAEWFDGLPAEIREMLARHRVADPRWANASKPLRDFLVDYEADCEARGFAPRHIRQSVAIIKQAMTALHWSTLSDVRPEPFAKWMRQLLADGLSPRSVNRRLICFKAFLNWIGRQIRSSVNTLEVVSKVSELGKQRITRRALTDEEFARLLKATDKGPEFRCMTGPEWALVFRLAATSGLRWSEIRSLQRNSFFLNEDPPTVCLEATCAKNKRSAVLPLRQDVADKIQAYFTENPALPYAKAFPMPISRDGAEVIRFYLERTGNPRKRLEPIPFEDKAGRRFDFHALRGLFATSLCRAGVSLAAARELMRHSTVDLTAKHYTHLALTDHQGAIESMSIFKNEEDGSANSEETDEDDENTG